LPPGHRSHKVCTSRFRSAGSHFRHETAAAQVCIGRQRPGARFSLAGRCRTIFVSRAALLETDIVTIYDEPKIDCHNHLLDPAHFGYAPDAWYHPVANEQGTAHQLTDLFDAYGSRHALVVGPNSGYDTDNRCLLDFLARGNGRFKGVAVVDNDIGRSELERLRGLGIVGITMQAALLGVDHFRDTTTLLHDLAALDMFADVQVDGDQLIEMAPILEPSGVRILIDHCGRPDPTAGLSQPGFRSLLHLASSGRYFVKISGLVKCSTETYPWRDSWPFVEALLEAFTPDRCMWGSDWPFLRAPERIDYGLVLALVERLIPDPAHRRKVLWDTPMRIFGFDSSRAQRDD
jgi:predicted TIM-barrel fold metal-dependent hydrolase